jgi:hypothetical protein
MELVRTRFHGSMIFHTDTSEIRASLSGDVMLKFPKWMVTPLSFYVPLAACMSKTFGII